MRAQRLLNWISIVLLTFPVGEVFIFSSENDGFEEDDPFYWINCSKIASFGGFIFMAEIASLGNTARSSLIILWGIVLNTLGHLLKYFSFDSFQNQVR